VAFAVKGTHWTVIDWKKFEEELEQTEQNMLKLVCMKTGPRKIMVFWLVKL
jgi:hypothetical protein